MRLKDAVSFSALALLLAAGFLPWRPGLAACAAAAGMAGTLRPRSLRAGSPRFWTFPALFFLALPFLSPAPDSYFLGAPYSAARLRDGLALLAHAYAFTVLTIFVSLSYSVEEITAFAARLGLRNTGLKIALAMIVLRSLKAMLSETWYYYSLDRPGRRARLAGLPVLFFAAMRNAAAAAEDLSVLFYLRGVRI